MMRVAVVGGGINGVMAAWEFAKSGCLVDLYERNSLMRATSSASTKMLHGGLRYLEHGRFDFVRESLHERSWWIRQAPHLAKPFQLVLPVYNGARSRWLIGAGIRLYDLLAKGSGFPSGRWLRANQLKTAFPSLSEEGLRGGYTYWDAQMDDYRLGMWAADQAKTEGVQVLENTPVEQIAVDGTLVTDTTRHYDRVVNLTGPWAAQLLQRSGISSKYQLNLIRGSHLVINRRVPMGCVLQVPGDKRLVFLLPNGENALLGTTEVPQPVSDRVEPSADEVEYLLSCYNTFFKDRLGLHDVVHAFAGLRPVVASNDDHSSASRESVIERQNKLINVFGGKWTTSRALAKKIVKVSMN